MSRSSFPLDQWATDAVFQAPYAAYPTRLDPTLLRIQRGFEPRLSPGPSQTNALLDYLARQASDARWRKVSTWIKGTDAAMAPIPPVGYNPRVSSYMPPLTVGGIPQDGFAHLLYSNPANGWGNSHGFDGEFWRGMGSVIAMNSTVSDSDSDYTGRIIHVDRGIADAVRFYDATLGWGVCIIAGAPGLFWQSIGCDRGLYHGQAQTTWIIGSSTGQLYSSTDGLNFAPIAAPPLGIGAVHFLKHTCHYPGMCSENDPGNAAWLAAGGIGTVLGMSADGAVWTVRPPPYTANPGSRGFAYSRDRRRWIGHDRGGAAGNTMYSLDNGANWFAGTSFRSAGIGVNAPQFATDCYDCVVISEDWDAYNILHVSADFGDTWREKQLPLDLSVTSRTILGYTMESPVRTSSLNSGCFYFVFTNPGAAVFNTFYSLRD